ncbi:MAG: M23 family metallopeptidase [Acidobacteria bacterium]|nr:M23 family metallopeptidase [Acidobacteriota bacterium]
MARARNRIVVAIVSAFIVFTNAAFAQQSSANQIVGSATAPQTESKTPPATPTIDNSAIILPANAVVPPAPFVVKKSANTVMVPTGAATNMINSAKLEDAPLDDNDIAKTGEAKKTVVPPPPEIKYAERPVIASSVKVGSTFGYRIDPFTRGARFHAGVDIKAAWGDPVGASQPGIVKFAGWHNGYGNLIIIDHGGGVTTHYAHLSSFTVAVGSKVSRGTIIGHAGSTGRSTSPHLHYEVRLNDSPVNPLHPLLLDESSEYFKFNPAAELPKAPATTDNQGPSTKLQQHNN